MSPGARLPLALGCAALLASGCTTLSGTVRGGFACRATEGTCAPTAAIDEAATRSEAAPGKLTTGKTAAPTGARTLRIVVAAYRDAAGRDHEARVVHAALPENPATSFRTPATTRDILAALGRAGAPEPVTAPVTLPSTDPFPAQLPERLVTPSQADGETPGAPAPDTGAPGRPPSPGRVPHPLLPEDREP